MRRKVEWSLIALALLVGPAPALIAQNPQSEAARMMLSKDREERARGVSLAQSIGPRNAGPALRNALIEALENQTVEYQASLRAFARGEDGPRWVEDEHDVYPTIIQMVISLRDPGALPALAGAVRTGWGVMHALLDFGERATPAVLAVVTSPDSDQSQVSSSLRVLRHMIEESGGRMPANLVDRTRAVVRERLREERFPPGLWNAIDLAAALDDPALRSILADLACDPDGLRARGFDQSHVERTRQRARDRLAGIPAAPRPARPGALD